MEVEGAGGSGGSPGGVMGGLWAEYKQSSMCLYILRPIDRLMCSVFVNLVQ